MPGIGNKQLHIRLPGNHWVWQIEDGAWRNAEVRKALDFYHQYGRNGEVLKALEVYDRIGQDLLALREITEEVKMALDKGATVQVAKKEEPQGDARLMNSLAKFLDF